MKIPITLISTKGKTKKELVKELWKNTKKFFRKKKEITNAYEFGKALEKQLEEMGIFEKIEIRKADPEDEYQVEFKPFQEGRSYQIMGQSKPKEKLSQSEKKRREKMTPERLEQRKRFVAMTEELNRNENPQYLIDWLRDSEQIPEEGESVEEFLERTDWTLEEENKWRKIDGLPPLKSKEEYKKLFKEE